MLLHKLSGIPFFTPFEKRGQRDLPSQGGICNIKPDVTPPFFQRGVKIKGLLNAAHRLPKQAIPR